MHITPELSHLIQRFWEVWETNPLIQQQRADHWRRVKRAATLLQPARIPQLTRDEIAAFLEDTDTWIGLRWNKEEFWERVFGINNSRLPQLRQDLADLVQRAERGLTAEDFNALKRIPGIGPGYLSEILALRFPDRYWLWNKQVRDFFEILQVDVKADLPWGKKTDQGEEYLAVGRHLDDLRQALSAAADRPVDYMQTDLFMYWANQRAGEDLQSAALVTANAAEDNELAEPFSRIFANQNEAQWAFDFLRDALERLGVSDPDDTRFALTLRHNYRTLRLNYGMWAVLQFYGNGSALERVGIAFLEEQVSLPPDIPHWEPFSDERLVRVYELPIAMARKFPAELQSAYEATFAYLAERFGDWSACPFRRFNQPEIAAAVFEPEKRAALLATGLQPEQIELADDGEELQSGEGYFSARTFDLLQALHEEPQRAFYLEHKEAFQVHLKEPFQRLMHDVAARLPATITARMETERNVFARILKNDFGQGGAWDFYWGAFYPQGGKRIADPQLSMWINHELLEFGFYIGDYGNASRQRFQRNSQEHYEVLVELLEPQLSNPSLIYGTYEDIVIAENGTVSSKIDMNWADWLRDPERGDFDASVVLPRIKALNYGTEGLVTEIVAIYQDLFPLILLAMEDDPLPSILAYLDLPIMQGGEGIVTLQPEYSLATCAEVTGFDAVELARWVRAIKRKKQAILYGPPGTGKTYIAEHLARHLIGGGDGFFDLVQFHPAYAYEDFIQGLRPQARKDGGLDYPLVPGRFLEFCAQAEKRTGRCVLIVDEINRANLARVFGELMYLLEYRDREIPLAGGKRFRIPKNVRIIGTMNTADRSIALVDHALRRRFAFLALYPNYEVLRRYHQGTGFPIEGLIRKLEELNRYIGDFHYQVGITFFLRDDLIDTLPDIWQMEIEPYLEEYFFDQPGSVDKFRWVNINRDHQVLP